jgi:4-carboxymuconolactone decarboxylase
MPESARSWREREALIEVSAAIAARDEEGLRRAFRLTSGMAAPADVDEVILQAHLFVGYPLALEAFRVWREITPAEAINQEGSSAPHHRGEEVCGAVYGSAYQKLLDSVQALHPDLGRWMLEVGYGRVIGRRSLDLATRELCIAALLAVCARLPECRSHSG